MLFIACSVIKSTSCLGPTRHYCLYYINYVTSDANDIRRFWDRHNQIRDAIASAVKMAETPNVNWNALIVFSERIALAWEQEPDFTRMSPEMTRPYNLSP
jgi:hypothetical protein